MEERGELGKIPLSRVPIPTRIFGKDGGGWDLGVGDSESGAPKDSDGDNNKVSEYEPVD